MSIYSPSSSLATGLTSLGAGLLSGAANGIGRLAKEVTGSEALGKIAGSVANKAAQDLSRKLATKVQHYSMDLQANLYDRLDQLGLSAFDTDYSRPSSNPLRIAGGLSIKDFKEIYFATDVDGLSRKNWFLLEINDLSGQAPVAKDGMKYSKFHLLTSSISHNPFTINSEAVPVGSGEMDKVISSSRTEMSLTAYDDEQGSIKEWLKRKCLSIAPSDGTVLLPYFYIFDVRVLFGSNIENKNCYEERYLMRVSEYNSDLDRRDQGLEEVQFKFTQWDTFMPLAMLR